MSVQSLVHVLLESWVHLLVSYTLLIIYLHLFYSHFFLLGYKFVKRWTPIALRYCKKAVFFSLFRQLLVIMPFTLATQRKWCWCPLDTNDLLFSYRQGPPFFAKGLTINNVLHRQCVHIESTHHPVAYFKFAIVVKFCPLHIDIEHVGNSVIPASSWVLEKPRQCIQTVHVRVVLTITKRSDICGPFFPR